MPATTPAAWYADPEGEPQWRYRDGTQWTGHTAPYQAAPAPAAPTGAPPTGQSPMSPATAEEHHGLLSRFRKTSAEKAAEVEYERLFESMSAGS